jgi:hypothetical protein
VAVSVSQGSLVAIAIKTGPKCKICQNSHRPEIDELLALRSQRLGPGTPAILAQCAEWGVPSPKEENLKTHLRNHVQLVDAGEAEAQAQDIDELFNRELGPGWQARPIDKDKYLDLLRTLSALELYRRAKAGKELGVTVDHALKATGESTKRKSDEKDEGFLASLAAGITHSNQTDSEGEVADGEDS